MAQFFARLHRITISVQISVQQQRLLEAVSLPLSGKIIYLDPGHGGPDGGAVGGKLLEKDVTLEVAFRVRDYLQEQGALVIMTRESDTDLAPEGTKGYSRRKAEDLRQRVKLINHSEAELYISIHLNAIPSQKWSGSPKLLLREICGK